MRIAVTSQNFRTVTGHAGRARRFVIFDVQPEMEPTEVARLDLPKEMCMHEYRGSERHPLDEMDVILSAEFGDGFARKMARRGVSVAATTETEPAMAVRAYAASHRADVLPAKPDSQDVRLGQPHRQHQHQHQHQHRHGCGCSAGSPAD